MKDFRARVLWWALKRRIKFDRPIIIAITGSFAKTSTKEALRCLLEKGANQTVTASWGNLNTFLGVPLGALGFKIDFYRQKITWQWIFILLNALIRSFNARIGKYLIIELGVDKPKDMELFNEQLKYDFAVITRLGEAHLVNFPDIDDYWREKSLIAKGLKESGTLIINSQDRHIKLSEDLAGNISIEKFACPDKMIALTIARTFGRMINLDESVIEKALSSCQMPTGRMTIYRGKEIILMDDAYNANPQSMVSALEWLNEDQSPCRRVAILGDMLELGEKEVEFHRKVGETARANADLIIAVGPLAKNYQPDYYYATTQEAAQQVVALLEKGDKILVKGSHGINMSIIVAAIKNEFL